MLFTEPYAGPTPIVQVISSARREVSLNVYYLSSRPILDALRAAHGRGVAVRVILDEHPYGMKPWMIRKEVRAVQATGAALQWAPPRFEAAPGRYVFDHAKYVCNGHECEIGTANYDWSAFHRNREYIYDTQNPTVVRAVHAVFNADRNDQRAPAFAHQVLVLSPGTSAGQLLQIINQHGPIDVESEELGPYAPVLDALAAKGRDLRLILPSSINGKDQRDVAFLRSHGCQVRLLPKKPLYMHAKMIVGGSLAFIGSENFTQTSLVDNREMGLLLNGSNIGKLQAQFNQDWARAGRHG
jgi:phosphatidylserine/phosphatidylglycerophosphate/cardiolipin synthase-like enzyme